jgi:hypothetical protein
LLVEGTSLLRPSSIGKISGFLINISTDRSGDMNGQLDRSKSRNTIKIKQKTDRGGHKDKDKFQSRILLVEILAYRL